MLYDRVTERFLSSLDKDDRLLVHFVYWTAHLPADRWHDADEFSHWLDQHEIDKKDGGEKISEYIDRWIQQLDECGWIEWRPANRTFRWLWKAFEMNSDECPLYVQPNLEIVVPPSIFPLDRWDVEKFAERITGGPVARYMLTKQSVTEPIAIGTMSMIYVFGWKPAVNTDCLSSCSRRLNGGGKHGRHLQEKKSKT